MILGGVRTCEAALQICADPCMALLHNPPTPRRCVQGGPGVGKTTLLRDVANLLADGFK